MFTIVLAPTSARCSTGARDSPLPDDAQLVQSTFKDDFGDYNDYNCCTDAQVVQSTFRLVEVVIEMVMVILVMIDHRR